jgi:hypothetical protein
MRMKLPILLLLATGVSVAQTPSVTVAPYHLEGSRPLQQQTAQAVVRDYLEAWQSLHAAFAHNQPDLLGRDFTGTAQTQLTKAIHKQSALGLHTAYNDQAHSIQIVFYSPDGLSLQMIDTVTYTQQVFAGDQSIARRPMKARYVVVMTPAERRWQVRVFQAQRP